MSAAEQLRIRLALLMLLVGGALAGLIAAEVLTRFVAPQRPTPAFVWPGSGGGSIYLLDSTFGVILRPNIDEPFVFGTRVKTNSIGLRDRNYTSKAPCEFRILSLGDSYAFGFGVENEQSYAKVVQNDLAKQYPAAKVSVINAGVTGYGTWQQRLAFHRLQPRLQADLVLATFTAGNDVYDNAVFKEQLRTGQQTPLGFLGNHSHLARLVLKVSFPLWFFLGNRDPERIELTVELLKKLENDFRAAGIPFLMLVIPARHQIRPQVEPSAEILMRLGLRRLVFRQNDRVVQHFREDNVPFIDLLSALAAADSLAPVSFVDDSHLNARGHQVMGREIVLRLRGLPLRRAESDSGAGPQIWCHK